MTSPTQPQPQPQFQPQPPGVPAAVKPAKPWYKKWWGIALIVLAVLVVLSFFVPKDQKATQQAAPSSTPAASATQTASETKEAAASEKPKTESVPREYESALSKAKQYLSFGGFSKAGLYEQLTSENGEKFSPEAAQYAMDHINANWKEQALKKAKTYQDTMHMSPSAIHDQLISEYGDKFTEEEAQYAVDNLPK